MAQLSRNRDTKRKNDIWGLLRAQSREWPESAWEGEEEGFRRRGRVSEKSDV